MTTTSRVGVAVGVLLLIAAAVATWLLVFNDGDDPDDVTLELLAADPQRHVRGVLEEFDCPAGRGDSPIVDADHDLGVRAVRSGYANGQIAVFTLQISAEVSVDRLELPVTHGDTFAQGIVCAFVDTSERATLESTSGSEATAVWSATGDAAGTLAIEGLEAGEVAVIEIWAVVEADREKSNIPLMLTVDSEESVKSNSDALDFSPSVQNTSDSPEISLVIEPDRKSIAAGERVDHTVTVENRSSSAAANFAVVEGLVDNGGVIDAIEVTDTEGSTTECDTTPASYTCDLGFLNPGEVVSFVVTLGADQASLPESRTPRPSTSDCATQTPHVCHEVDFTQTGSFAPARAGDERKVTITTSETFLATVEHDPETAYIGGSLILDISVAVSDNESRAGDVVVTVEACNNGVTRYDRGDDGPNNEPDFLLGPNEIWHYECRADNVTSATTFAVVNSTIGAEPVEEILALNLNIVNPSMSIEAVAAVDGSAWNVSNDGDQPIDDVDLDSATEGCTAEVEDGDEGMAGVLEVGEVWYVTCAVQDAQLRAFGFDPLRGPVVAET